MYKKNTGLVIIGLLLLNGILSYIPVSDSEPLVTLVGVEMPGSAYNGTAFTVTVYVYPNQGISTLEIWRCSFNTNKANATGIVKGTDHIFGSSPQWWDNGTINNTEGNITFIMSGDGAYTGEGNGATGNHTFCEITFMPNATGTFYLHLDTVKVYDDGAVALIPSTTINGSIAIQEALALPGTPTNVDSISYGSTWINVTWTNGTNSTHTKIVSATGGYPANNPYASGVLVPDLEYHNFTGLTPGETYFFRLWGYNASGYSASSATTYCTTDSTGSGHPDPPTSLVAEAYNSTRIDLSWSGPLSADRYVLCGQEGSFPSDHDTSQIYNGTGYNYQHGSGLGVMGEGELSPATTYYYRLWTYDSTNNTYSLSFLWESETTLVSTSNNPPLLSNEDPGNGETGVELTPACDVIFNDADGDLLDIYLYSKTGDTWILEYTWLSQYPGSYPTGTSKGFVYNNATEYNTVYYWKIECTDGADWTNETYSFTTMSPINVAPNQPGLPHPANGSTSIYPLVNLSCVVTDSDGDALDVYFFNANTSQVIPINDNLDNYIYNVPSGERAWMWYSVPENTTFYWYSLCWDGTVWSNQSDTWHFTTIEASPGYHSPNLPSNPSPYHNQLNVPVDVTVSWYISHPDGPREMLVELYRGTSPGILSLVDTWSRYGNQTMTDLWTGLTYNEDYYWRVDITGNLQPYTIVGDTWHFHTGTTTGYQIMFQTYYINDESGNRISIVGVNISYYFPTTNATYIYMDSEITDTDGIATINTGATYPILYYWDFTPQSGYVGMKKIPILVDPDNPKIEEIRLYRVGEANTITTMITVWEHGSPFPLTGVNMTVLPGYPIPDAGTYTSGNGSTFQLIFYEPTLTSDTTRILLTKDGYHNLTQEIDIVNWKNHNLYMYKYGAINTGNASTWSFTDFFDIFGALRDNAGIITGGDNELGASIIVIIILAAVFYFAYTRVQLYGAVVVVFFIALIFILTGFVGWEIIIIPLIPVLIPFASKFASGIVGNRGNNQNGG